MEEVSLALDSEEEVTMQTLKLGSMRLISVDKLKGLPPMREVGCASNFGKVVIEVRQLTRVNAMRKLECGQERDATSCHRDVQTSGTVRVKKQREFRRTDLLRAHGSREEKSSPVTKSTKLGFKQVEDLGRYLGSPLLHQRVNMDTYDFLINKVWAKLSGCDTRKLSMAGRVTFVRSILLTILIYFMSSTIIPISTCNEIEKLVRAFIWIISLEMSHFMRTLQSKIWCDRMASGTRTGRDDGIWITFFCLSIWLLWKRRNTFVFQGAHSDSKELMRTALSWARLYNDTLANRKIEMMSDDSMQWTAPKDDWVKLNSDGLVDLDINIAAVGGLLRNSAGEWILGFAKKFVMFRYSKLKLARYWKGSN
ncbi:hypothetical protein PVK06_043006 [Gossypium arboreum]|uniref:Uncharacterized protein n=1 Tax=Gossypium arboreum TaxID=29729 RepID=A0ABR0MMC0_GOSAR|nr:hypothetical protein PVK06_043006 [Gossypium arboreum]